jgi:hypothetical protein
MQTTPSEPLFTSKKLQVHAWWYCTTLLSTKNYRREEIAIGPAFRAGGTRYTIADRVLLSSDIIASFKKR